MTQQTVHQPSQPSIDPHRQPASLKSLASPITLLALVIVLVAVAGGIYLLLTSGEDSEETASSEAVEASRVASFWDYDRVWLAGDNHLVLMSEGETDEEGVYINFSVLDYATGESLLAVSGDESELSPDLRYLVISDEASGKTQIVDLTVPAVQYTLEESYPDLEISPYEPVAVLYDYNVEGEIALLNLETGEVYARLPDGYPDFAARGILKAGGEFFDTATGEAIPDLTGGNARVSPDEQYLVVWGENYDSANATPLQIMNVETKTIIAELPDLTNLSYDWFFLEQSHYFVIASEETNQVYIIDVTTGETQTVEGSLPDDLYSDEKVAVLREAATAIDIIDPASGAVLQTLDPAIDTENYSDLLIHIRDHYVLIMDEYGGNVYVYDVDSADLVREFHSERIGGGFFPGDDLMILLINWENAEASLYQLNEEEPLAEGMLLGLGYTAPRPPENAATSLIMEKALLALYQPEQEQTVLIQLSSGSIIATIDNFPFVAGGSGEFLYYPDQGVIMVGYPVAELYSTGSGIPDWLPAPRPNSGIAKSTSDDGVTPYAAPSEDAEVLDSRFLYAEVLGRQGDWLCILYEDWDTDDLMCGWTKESDWAVIDSWDGVPELDPALPLGGLRE